MAHNHYDELLNSLKRLYSHPEFSDLDIVSSHKSYPVHKAVVCPRSPYLAKKCRDPAFGVESKTVEVKDDDPQAVHLVIEYLYNLNYSDTLPDELLQPNGHPNYQNGDTPQDCAIESPVLVTNGFGHSNNNAQGSVVPEDIRGESPSAAPIASPQMDNDAPASIGGDSALDDFLPIKKPLAPKKKKKGKKGRKASDVSESTLLEGATEEPQPTPQQEDESQPGPEPAAPETPRQITSPSPAPLPQDRLTTHAKLHSLSAKYGMTELQALSLSKFREQAQNGWDADDFVRAAGEVYASPLVAEENHREMRGAVTGLVFGHKELLDKGGMRDILRGDLGLDLIMRFREEGVW